MISMLHYRLQSLVAVAMMCGTGLAVSAPISPVAQRIAQRIDSLDVENHWPAGVHVKWDTGVPDGRPEKLPGKHTHCSAFVAAAARELGIYILRPPEHPQVLLANAQYDWLEQEGTGHGWRPLPSAQAAQRFANEGWLVWQPTRITTMTGPATSQSSDRVISAKRR